MNTQTPNPLLRRGKFLWLDPAAQKVYIQELKKRISDGFYSSDRIFSKVVDDIAPILDELVISD